MESCIPRRWWSMAYGRSPAHPTSTIAVSSSMTRSMRSCWARTPASSSPSSSSTTCTTPRPSSFRPGASAQHSRSCANSSGGYIFDDFYSNIDADSYDNVGAGFYHEPVININGNAYPKSALLLKGGTIRNPRIIQSGYTEPLNNESLPAIQIQPPCPNITILGDYVSGAVSISAKLGGYFESPDYAVKMPQKAFAGVGAVAVRSDAAHTTIRGIRSVGAVQKGRGGIELGLTAVDSRIEDCVVDAMVAPRATLRSNNRTNAGVAY